MDKTNATFARFGNEIINLETIIGIRYLEGNYPSLEITTTSGIWTIEPRNVQEAWAYFSQISDRALIKTD